MKIKNSMKIRSPREAGKLKIKYDKIRGMKDEQDAVLRLADSIAGLLRDFCENQPYTKSILNMFKEGKIVNEI